MRQRDRRRIRRLGSRAHVDTGIGMSPEVMAIMFEPFRQGLRTLDRPRGGLGLGLSLVRGIVQLHGSGSRRAARVRDMAACLPFA